jgi:hypothetical protein
MINASHIHGQLESHERNEDDRVRCTVNTSEESITYNWTDNIICFIASHICIFVYLNGLYLVI